MAIMAFLLSCSKKDESCDCIPPPSISYNDVILKFEGMTGGQPMELLKTFKDPLGRDLHVELFKFYVSDIYVNSGANQTKVGKVDLITLEDPNVIGPGNDLKYTVLKVPYGNYDGITFHIGLDPAQNESDPNSFAPDHPLSSAQNTHWGTWSNYKFLMMEGKGDWDMNGTLTDIYGYHTGFDQCYREVTLTSQVSSDASGSTDTIRVTFDFNDIFFGSDTLDMKIFPTWHGDTSTIWISETLSDNFSKALKLK